MEIRNNLHSELKAHRREQRERERGRLLKDGWRERRSLDVLVIVVGHPRNVDPRTRKLAVRWVAQFNNVVQGFGGNEIERGIGRTYLAEFIEQSVFPR